jgi:hypothetical protein
MMSRNCSTVRENSPDSSQGFVNIHDDNQRYFLDFLGLERYSPALGFSMFSYQKFGILALLDRREKPQP